MRPRRYLPILLALLVAVVPFARAAQQDQVRPGTVVQNMAPRAAARAWMDANAALVDGWFLGP